MTAANPDTAEPTFTQARIRLSQEGAELLWRILLAEETRLLTHRRQVPEEDVAWFQDEVKQLRRVKDELERTIFEQGWVD